jgi:hypothetical protein
MNILVKAAKMMDLYLFLIIKNVKKRGDIKPPLLITVYYRKTINYKDFL